MGKLTTIRARGEPHYIGQSHLVVVPWWVNMPVVEAGECGIHQTCDSSRTSKIKKVMGG